MENHVTIPIMSQIWIWGIVSLFVTIYILFHFGKNEKLRPNMKIIVAMILLFREVFIQAMELYYGTWSWETSLPLQMCDISKLLAMFLLLKYREWMFVFLMLLGAPGALQSFLTPELTNGSTWFGIFEYYIGHSAIIAVPLYFFFVEKRLMPKWGWLKAFLIGNGILVIVGFINYLIGANYIYLCQRPMADNPMIIGEWPYYLIGLQVFGFAHIVGLYFLFRYLQSWRINRA